MYDYICPNCLKETEELVKDRSDSVVCDCGAIMDRQISAGNLGGFDKLGRS